MSEHIEYNGKIYTFVKEVKGQGYFRRTERLHRRVWEDNHGPIPKGYAIHHKDGNTRNNDISNLECLTIRDHHLIHFCSEKQTAHLHKCRAKANLYHKSEKGRKRSGEISREAWKTRPPIPFECIVCQKRGMTRNRAGTKYCSQKCRSFSGKLSYLKKRLCIICNGEYISPLQEVRTCSRRCSARLAHRTKAEKHSNGSIPSDRHTVL